MSSMFQVYLQFSISEKDLDKLSKQDKMMFNYWFNQEQEPKEVPEHEFFTYDDWNSFVQYGSYYCYPELVVSNIYDKVNERRNILSVFCVKDRNSAETIKLIKLFFAYIKSLGNLKCFIGWYRREDEDTLHLEF